jgi:hypothetical protein
MTITLQNIVQPTTDLDRPRGPIYPERTNRDAWWEYLSGATRSVWWSPPKKQNNKGRRHKVGREAGSVQNADTADLDLSDAGWRPVDPSESVLSVASKSLPMDVSASKLDADSADTAEDEAAQSDTPVGPREPTPLIIRSIDHVCSSSLLFSASPHCVPTAYVNPLAYVFHALDQSSPQFVAARR